MDIINLYLRTEFAENREMHLATSDSKIFLMKPLPSNRAKNNATGCIAKSGRFSRTREKQARERLSQPRPGECRSGERPSARVPSDSARLYQQLEQQIEERTRALKEEIAERERVFARSVLDALSESICVLDATGMIVATNRAWHTFTDASLPGPLHAAEGANYLAVCDAATGADAQDAQALAAGIRSVIGGERREFCMEYPCATPTELRWFAGRVTRFPGDGPVRLVVALEDITEQKWTEQVLRESIELAETAQQEAELAERREEKRRQEAERRRHIAESLRDIVSILNSNHPLDDVLDYIVSQARSMLGSQAAAVYCASGTNGEVLVQVAQSLPGDSLSNALCSTAQYRLEHVPLSPWPVTIPDTAAMVVSQGDPSPEIQDLFVLAPPVDAYRALMGVPILINDEIYGRLRLYYRNPHVFSDEEAELATMFSDQIALAIETARLREQAKQKAISDERNRLARDLHDSVTQTIFSANLIAEALPRVWESYPEEGRRGLENLHRLIQGALAEMRTLLLELRPAAIVEKKPGELLKQLTQTIASQTRAAIAFTVEGDRTLPAEVQIAFYRIAQEALNNIIKHARANRIAVQLCSSPDSVVLRISDNGCGFDPCAIPPDHLGVSIMRERAVSIGATFTLTSQPGLGAEVLIMWQESTGEQAHDRIRHDPSDDCR